MEKTIFEQLGGTDTMQGDYCLPDLTLPTEEERPVGVWGQRRKQYVRQTDFQILRCTSFCFHRILMRLHDSQ